MKLLSYPSGAWPPAAKFDRRSDVVHQPVSPCVVALARSDAHGPGRLTTILIAEDEPGVAAVVRKGLTRHGFATTTAASGAEALDQALAGEVDLMVLDLGLPDLDGFDVLARLRAAGSLLPVIVLTARGDVYDRVAGLERGADDYMTKPSRVEELLARVRLRLRPARETRVPDLLVAAGLALDLRTRTAVVGERTVALTAREFSILELLLRNRGQVLTRQQILSRLWGYDFDPQSNLVDVYVRILRRKLGDGHITTVRGAGYRCG